MPLVQLVHREQREVKGHRVNKVLMVSQDLLVKLALWEQQVDSVTRDLLVLLVQVVQLVYLEILVTWDLLDLRDLQGLRDSRVSTVFKEQRGSLVRRAATVSLVQEEPLEPPATLAQLVPLDSRALKGPLAVQVLLDNQVFKVQVELMVVQVKQVRLDLKALQDNEEIRDPWAFLGLKELQVLKEVRVLKDQLVSKVQLDLLALLDHLVHLGHQEIQVLQVARVLLDNLEILDYQEEPVQQARQDREVFKDLKELQDLLVQRDHRVQLEIQEHQVSKAQMEPLEQLAHQA